MTKHEHRSRLTVPVEDPLSGVCSAGPAFLVGFLAKNPALTTIPAYDIIFPHLGAVPRQARRAPVQIAWHLFTA